MQAKSGERSWIKYRKRLRLGAVEPFVPERRFRHFGVMPVMDELEEQDRQLIYKRYFQNKTQLEVASKLNISQVQVSRLEKNALTRIKSQV